MGTVLVVDDDDDIREPIRDLLAAEGHAVCEAGNGEEALEVLAEMPTRPCVVLLDMMMPRMNGNEFLEAIAHQPKLAALSVVVVSAYAGVVRGAVRAVLSKPVDLTVLLAEVEKHCSAACVT